ncbi:putative serine protease K12H4.7 [Haliotis rufescens]|uniref:putative serine protease K12H4.7 n=1 Tax=Haliotis rufescens TaxID=6454 RepID=UPI00201F0FC0|nr:putative serine protease K12H4.7 [Haliotis rufescens]
MNGHNITTYVVIVSCVVVCVLGSIDLHPRRVDDVHKSAEDAPSPSLSTVTERWFQQKLDHFSVTDNRQWKQRYYINDKFHKPGGPAFLYIGPELALPAIYAEEGAWLEYAETYHAIGFALEHRYYGQSRPTADLSTANLRYLSIDQVLEDLASFIVATNKEHNFKDIKWITFGASYGGLVSTWMRLKFPHLVTGAVAHSAPLAMPTFSPDYLVGAGESLRKVPGCYETVSAAFDEVRENLKTDTGMKNLQSLFRVCDFDPTNKLDVENLMMDLVAPFVSTIQFNNVHAGSLMLIPDHSISSMCKVLTDTRTGPPLLRFADFARIYYQNYTAQKDQCRNTTFASLVNTGSYINYTNDNAFSVRQWRYQECTQMGLFVTTTSDRQPLGNAVGENYYYKLCEGLFGPAFNESLVKRGHDYVLMNYGGLGIRVTNIIYTQGMNDPWTKYGFTKNPNPRAYAVVIKGVGHVAAMFPSSSSDSADLKNGRLEIQRHLGQLLSSRDVAIVG